MIFGISKTTAAGVVSLLIAVCLVLLSSGSPIIGPKATMWITLALAVLRAIIGFLQGDPTDAKAASSVAGKVGIVLLAFMLWPAMAHAQTPAPGGAGLNFSAETTALAAYNVDRGRDWTVGTEAVEVLQVSSFGASKQHLLDVIGRQYVLDSFNSYQGGFRFEPSLKSFLGEHTDIPADAFKVAVDGSVGTSIYSSGTHIAWSVLGSASYALNGSGTLQWTTVKAGVLRSGSQTIPIVSTGLQYFFHKAS